MHEFPSESWVNALEMALNGDARYAHVARNWEGDIVFQVEPDRPGGGLAGERSWVYFDLWHGKCRRSGFHDEPEGLPSDPTFTLTARRADFAKVITGALDPMQAMLTRKIQVRGNFGYFLRNVPVVLDFVRCCQTVETRL